MLNTLLIILQFDFLLNSQMIDRSNGSIKVYEDPVLLVRG